LIEQSVSDYLTPVNHLDADKTIRDVIKAFSIRKTDNLILTKNEKDYIGIITASDIQKRVLALNLDQDNPAYLIMSSPVIFIDNCTTLLDAVNICDEKSVNHLVVKNEYGIIGGILRINDVYRAFKDSLSFYIANIRKAESNEELKKCFRVHQLLLEPLIRSEISVKHLTMITSSVSDAAVRRVIDLTIKEIGDPPAKFSFICLGSEGRKEETLFTDQDNAIIYEDVPAEKESIANEYFNKLGEKVCDSLNYIGYAFCKGNIMAKNRQWCKPYSEWEKYFANWIATPEPQNLLEATIFFDFRNVYGDEAFAAGLRKTISRLIRERLLFLYHLAYNTYNVKPQQISSGSIMTEKNAGTVDLKEAVNIIIMFARTYCLQNDIWYSNTLERLNALREKSIISETTAEEMIFAYNFLMRLRFRNQAELSAGKLPLSNILNSQKLQGIELSGLKKVLGLIPGYQHKISVDFRIST
jgi:CBS domain-containing protein